MSFIFHQQIDLTLPVSSGVLSKAHNYLLTIQHFLDPLQFGILAHTEAIHKTFSFISYSWDGCYTLLHTIVDLS